MGGLGTAYHAAKSMVDYLGDSDVGFPPVSDALKVKFEKNELFDLEDGPILQDKEARAEVKDTLLGAIFAISMHLIANEVATAKDLDLGICTALAWPKGPLTLMNEMGMEETARLVKKVG